MIYVSREVKDVAVSMYHMCIGLNWTTGPASDFFNAFHNDIVDCGPYYEHISSYTQLRHLENLLFLTYEELSINSLESIKKVSAFLECSYNDVQLNQLVEYVSFKKMKGKFGSIAQNSNLEQVSYCQENNIFQTLIEIMICNFYF